MDDELSADIAAVNCCPADHRSTTAPNVINIIQGDISGTASQIGTITGDVHLTRR